MKHIILILSLFALHSSLFALAAVPLRWTVETSRAVPATFEAYQGETLELEAALQSYGKPLEAPDKYALYWQTNGMGNAWWTAPCTNNQQPSTNNLLHATWRPEYDVGARAYSCFIGATGTIYRASFQLRMRPSPGALPNELPLPKPVIDFARVTVEHADAAPWASTGEVVRLVGALADDVAAAQTAATNYTDRATGEVVRLVGALADEKQDKLTSANAGANISIARHQSHRWLDSSRLEAVGYTTEYPLEYGTYIPLYSDEACTVEIGDVYRYTQSIGGSYWYECGAYISGCVIDTEYEDTVIISTYGLATTNDLAEAVGRLVDEASGARMRIRLSNGELYLIQEDKQ